MAPRRTSEIRHSPRTNEGIMIMSSKFKDLIHQKRKKTQFSKANQSSRIQKVSNKKSGSTSYPRQNLGFCYRWNQKGHLSNQCPQWKTVAYVEEEESQEDEMEPNFEEEINELELDEGEQLSCVIQRILLTLKTKTRSQRHSLLRTRCTINDKVCNVILDSGSSENIVSWKLVQALNLKLDLHLHPYKMSWIKKSGEAQISSTCIIPLSIGNFYTDQIICDVIDMDVCHVLLGRP